MRVRVPPPPLSHFVDYLWLQEAVAPPSALERIVPSATTELVIALHDTPLRASTTAATGVVVPVGSAMVCGVQLCPFDTLPQGLLIGVHFKPGGAFPFFAPLAAELRDARVGLDELWGSAATVLRERLAAAPTAGEQFALLERALLARATRPLARHPAVAYALGALDGAAGRVTVASVRKEIGLSARRFIELFDREVGLTPKLFARVRRFQAVLRRLEEPASAGWVEVALAHGYFDQAHLIRDFQQFTGFAPTAYLPRRAASPNHIALSETG